jgi:HlyD family secretion protein
MTHKRPRKRRKIIIFAVILLGITGLVLAALLRKQEPVISIQTEKVGRRDITETVVANGRIQPTIEVKISAEVSGEIIELPVKEGDQVQQGQLLVKIKSDVYVASRKSAEASFLSSQASQALAEANYRKAKQEFERHQGLFRDGLISDSVFLDYQTSFDIAEQQLKQAAHQIQVARASLDRAEEELRKTEIYSPLTGTISKLNSELGERVVGTAMMSGTEIMTVADLNQMEARVDIGEIDIVLLQLGQTVKLQVDAFRDRKFAGTVSEIANSSKITAGGQSQEAIKFEVKIRIDEPAAFRPGMSVTTEIQTRSRTNVLAVPIQSVTTRLPKAPAKSIDAKSSSTETNGANSSAATNASATTNASTAAEGSATNETTTTNAASDTARRKANEPPKPIEVVFLVENDRAKMVPVERGISDEGYTEIIKGLEEGQEVVSGGYKAISRDLEDGKRVRRGRDTGPDSPPGPETRP